MMLDKKSASRQKSIYRGKSLFRGTLFRGSTVVAIMIQYGPVFPDHINQYSPVC